MQLYMMTRGAIPEVTEFINWIRYRLYRWKHKGKHVLRPVGVRPVQLWEVTFPKEHYEEVRLTLGESAGKLKSWQKAAIRKALGAKKMPHVDVPEGPGRNMAHFEVAREFIGIRHDEEDDDGEEVI